MKTAGVATKVSTAKSATKEKVRKSLHRLQPAATDKENLVGGGRTLRSSISTKEGFKKNEMSAEVIKPDPKKKKSTASKEKSIQTGRDYKTVEVSKEDLTSEAGPSENYWEVLAERRRIALNDALDENKKYAERISTLEEENRIYKEQLDECKSLIEVLKEMLGEDENSINNSLEDTL